jgi:hypothetical protein
LHRADPLTNALPVIEIDAAAHVFLSRILSFVAEPFWPNAIAMVKADYAGLLFMAEVYWDLEFELQRQGFDYTYDKRPYDRLRGVDAAYDRDGDALLARGLYLDMPAWGYHVFALVARPV